MNAMLMIAPVAIILVAENLGHFKAVSAMTGKICRRIWDAVSLQMVCVLPYPLLWEVRE